MDEITLESTGNTIILERDSAKEVVQQLSYDEIFDAIAESTSKRKFSRRGVFERFCDDYKEELGMLLQKFWGRQSDACPLEATEHENELGEWEKWVDKGIDYPQ